MARFRSRTDTLKRRPEGGYSISAADFDGDGMLDVATWSGHAGASDGMHVFRSVKPGLQAVATVDLNADGQLDILAANARNGHVTPLIGNGDNTFTRQADILAGLGTVALAVGDLTADGHSDFVTANEFVNTVSVLVNDGAGSFLRADLATGENPVAVAIGDVNRDTRQDFVVANQGDSTLSLFTQQEDGSFLRSDIPTGSAPEDLELVDLNGDGCLDIAVTIPQADNILVHFGSDEGTFADVLVIPAGLTPNHVATGDLNADGRPDLVVSYPHDNKIGILYGQGADRVTRPQMMEVGQQPTDLVLEDCDGDGRVDIVVLNSDGNDATVLLNRFDPAKVYTYQPVAEDPDGDAITFALLDGPGGMLLDPATGAISWAPNSDQYGEHPVTIEASDGRGGAATQSYVIAAGLPRDNHAPLILTDPQTTVPGTLPYAYPIRAVDPDGDPLHIAAGDGAGRDELRSVHAADRLGGARHSTGLRRISSRRCSG